MEPGRVRLKDIPQLLHHLGNHPQLGKPTIFMLQEVTLEEHGLHCCSEHKWTVLAHRESREETERRGTGIAYHASAITRRDTPSAATASIEASLQTTKGSKLHIASAHLPHHVTLEQTHHVLHTWQTNHNQLHHHPCVIGADWNETFATDKQTATTAKGELILDWLSQQNQHLPPQQDNEPSYHPYNTTMRSRCLDYISSSRKILQQVGPIAGSRDFALSDHDAVIAEVEQRANNNTAKTNFAHRPMKLKSLGVHIPPAPPMAHPWNSLATLALSITEAYPKPKFQESKQLKQHRHKMTTGQIPADQRRQHWKLVQAAHKRGRRQWDHAQAAKAAKGDWQAYKQSKSQPQQMQWGRRLITNKDWQQHMTQHLNAIFKQQPDTQVRSEFERMRRLLETRCKETPYNIVEEEELRAIQERWRRKKATADSREAGEATRKEEEAEKDDAGRGEEPCRMQPSNNHPWHKNTRPAEPELKEDSPDAEDLGMTIS